MSEFEESIQELRQFIIYDFVKETVKASPGRKYL